MGNISLRRLLATSLTLAAFLWLFISQPAVAQGAAEYFQVNYSSVTFSRNEVTGGETFDATVSGNASCIKDLPVTVSEGSITSRVIAQNVLTGSVVTLNPSYSLTIYPFPSKAGETVQMTRTIPLQFPAGAAAGDYYVSGELIEAKVKILFVWTSVARYLPSSQPMGQVKLVAPPTGGGGGGGGPGLPPPPPPPAPPESPSTSAPPQSPSVPPSPVLPPTSPEPSPMPASGSPAVSPSVPAPPELPTVSAPAIPSSAPSAPPLPVSESSAVTPRRVPWSGVAAVILAATVVSVILMMRWRVRRGG